MDDIYNSEARIISLDFRLNLEKVLSEIPPHFVLQGNLDPSVLLGNKKIVIEKTKNILDIMAKRPGYIFNLGHGILPETPVENVKAMVETVNNWPEY